MATTATITPPPTELETQNANIAATAATPNGPVAANQNLPSNFGSDSTGRIFRYDASGNPAGASTAPTNPATPTTPSSNNNLTLNANLTPDQYQQQYGPKPVDEGAIKESVRAENQARIDAINGVYNNLVAGQEVTNQNNAGRTRAVDARSGLLGSDFGNAQAATTDALGQKAIGAINAERASKIDAVYQNIDALANQQIAAAKQEAVGKADAYQKYLTQAQTKAENSLTQLGASGTSYDTLKSENPQALQTLKDNTGLSDFEIALKLNASAPAAAKINWQNKIVGDNLVVYGVNPLTGKSEVHSTPLPAGTNPNTIHFSTDGTIWSESPDGKTATQIGGSPKVQTKTVNKNSYTSTDGGKTWTHTPGISGPTPGSGGTGGGGGSGKISKAEQSAINQALSHAAGNDGFVSPQDYASAKQDWIARGGSATLFDTSMRGLRNPTNPNYGVGGNYSKAAADRANASSSSSSTPTAQ